MNTTLLATALVAASGLFIPASFAQTRSTAYEGMVFDLPSSESGWELKVAEDGYLVTKKFPSDRSPARSNGGAAVMVIARPTEAKSAFADAFEKSVQGFVTQYKARHVATSTGLTINRHPIKEQQFCCFGPDTQMRAVGIDNGKRHTFVQIITLSLQKEDENEALRAFEALVRSLRPTAADRAFAIMPATETDALKGLYRTLKTGVRTNTSGMMEFYSEIETMVFEGQGLFSTVPPSGAQGVAAHCRSQPTDCGFYRLKGRGLLSGGTIEQLKIINDYGMITSSEQPIAVSADAITIGENVYKKIPPFPAGTRLDGFWRALSASTGQNVSTSRGLLSEKTLKLSRDGRFERTNFTSVTDAIDSGGARTSIIGNNASPAESGRYMIEGHLIRLTGDDGKVDAMSIFNPDAPSIDLLVINGSNFLKQKGKE
jgi:hypothetical protein